MTVGTRPPPSRAVTRSRQSCAALRPNVSPSTWSGRSASGPGQPRDHGLDERRRLAGARPGEHQQRPAAVVDDRALVGVELRRRPPAAAPRGRARAAASRRRPGHRHGADPTTPVRQPPAAITCAGDPAGAPPCRPGCRPGAAARPPRAAAAAPRPRGTAPAGRRRVRPGATGTPPPHRDITRADLPGTAARASAAAMSPYAITRPGGIARDQVEHAARRTASAAPGHAAGTDRRSLPACADRAPGARRDLRRVPRRADGTIAR